MSFSYLTQGEMLFFEKIKHQCSVIFNVGTRDDTYYLDSQAQAEFHLFEPDPYFITLLQNKYKNKVKAYFNNFALGNSNCQMTYYKDTQSLTKRVYDLKSSDDANNLMMVNVYKLDDYCREKAISKIDFLKIDVEGFELEVLKGAKEMINNCRYIQFEYGGTYKDSRIRLKDIYDFFDFSWNFYLIQPTKLKYCPNINENYQYANYIISRNKLI